MNETLPSAKPSSSPAVVMVHAAKQALRKTVKSKLRQLSEQTLQEQSLAVTRKVLAHPTYINARRLSVYVSMPTSELRTDEIVKDALARGKALFIPYICPGQMSTMRFLRLKDMHDFESLQPDKWKIRSLSEHNIQAREDALNEETIQGLDLILMPGVAFDRQLNRLGHGRGYYDTYLAKCAVFSRKHGLNPPPTIALALDEQVLPASQTVPCIENVDDEAGQAHLDIKPDELIWPSGHIING